MNASECLWIWVHIHSIEREPLCESIGEWVSTYAADLYARVQSKNFTNLFVYLFIPKSRVHFRSRSGPICVGFLDRDQQWSLLHGLMIQIELSSPDRRQLSGLHNALTTNSDLRNMVQFCSLLWLIKRLFCWAVFLFLAFAGCCARGRMRQPLIKRSRLSGSGFSKKAIANDRIATLDSNPHRWRSEVYEWHRY